MASNTHASAVVVGDRGVLISGASGLGKSGLALALVVHARSFGLFGRLVGDDQLLLSSRNGRLFCAVPAALAGLAEIRGLGPRPVAHEPLAPVDLHVVLVEKGVAQRFPEPESGVLAGCAVPVLRLAGGDRDGALLAIASCLDLPPFGRNP
jgi:serine kinase of HPr protein (carbohydrate metabolism regulator)